MNNEISNYLPKILKQLEEHLTHANHKFMQRIVAAVITAQTLSLNKADFMANLTAEEGEITADNFRARIKAINAALKKLDSGINLKSVKTALNLEINADTLQQFAQEQVLSKLKRRSTVEAIDESRIVPAMASATRTTQMQRQVMFSYAWDMNPRQLELQHAFATRLKDALTAPPAQYKNSHKVSLFWDISDNGFKIGENQKQQQNTACAVTPIALIIYTDKYLYSRACQAEIDYFLDGDGNNHPGRMGIVIPFSSTFGDMDARYQINLAATPKQKTVMILLESGVESDINAFIKTIVNCVYDWFEAYFTPPPADDRAIPEKLARSRQLDINPDKHQATHAKCAASAEAVNIVEHMLTWGLSTDPSTERLFYLLGDFGAGKSTACQLLTKAMMQRYENSATETVEQVLPIYLDLKKLLNALDPNKAHDDAPIEALLEEMLKKAGSTDIKGQEVIAFIQHHPCLVIFDGFDEIGQKLTEAQQVGLLNKMLGILPDAVYSEDLERLTAKGDFKGNRQHHVPLRTRIVISCRTHFFESAHKEQAFKRAYYRSNAGEQQRDIKNYQNYYLLPFTKAQIKNYLINWLGDTAGTRAVQFIETVHDLSGLSEKPIMLRLIKDLIPELELKAQQSQHINAATLYNTLFQQISQRDVDKHLIQLDEKQRLLLHFAVYLWQQRSTELNRLVLQDWFLQFKTQLPILSVDISTGKYSIDLLLQDLHNASLLVRDGDDNYRFAHSSFYEYFLACGLFETVRLAELSPGQSFTVLTKQVDGLTLSAETVQFLLDWRLTTNTHYRQAFDKHWLWLQQQDCPVAIKTLTFQIWLTAYQSGQDFPLPVKPDWQGMRFEHVKLSARVGQVIDWSGANLAGCHMLACDIKGVRFGAADFSLANIRLSYFERCDFSGITASDSTWHRNRFWHCQGDADWQQQLQTLTTPLARNFVMPNSTLKQALHNNADCRLKLQLNIGMQSALAYSPDGSYIVSGGGRGNLRAALSLAELMVSCASGM
ncbi:MAG: hypothetical protein NTV00_11690 [Methylococcales bacterium]|nr:hypothetical protein [Methylococcales bacterium]